MRKNKLIQIRILFIFGFLQILQNGFSFDLKDTIVNQVDSSFYLVVDSNARFLNGDINNFRIYIMQNLTFQDDYTIINKIIFSFDVDWNGKVKDVKIIKSSGVIGFDNQLVNLIQNSPKWTPAMIKNKRVGQRFKMPMTICLQ